MGIRISYEGEAMRIDGHLLTGEESLESTTKGIRIIAKKLCLLIPKEAEAKVINFYFSHKFKEAKKKTLQEKKQMLLSFQQETGLTELHLKQITGANLKKSSFCKEGNLIENPIAILNTNRKGDFIDGNYLVTKDEEGKIVSRVGSSYGVLTPFDFDLFNCMFNFLTEVEIEGKKLDIIAFTDYAILKKMGKELGGNYKLLEKGKERIATMNIDIPRFVKPNTEPLGISNYIIFKASYRTNTEIGKGKGKLSPLKYNYFVLNDLISNSLKDKYAMWLNWNIYKELETPLDKRLYEYLTKKQGKSKPCYEEGILSLCRKLPLDTKQIAGAKKRIGASLDRLKEAKLIKDWRFIEQNIKVYYYERKPKAPAPCKPKDPLELEAYKTMVGIGINPIVALDLMKKHPLDHIRRQLDWIKHRKAKNKAGMLVKAIAENYIIPKEAEDRIGSRVDKEVAPCLKDLLKGIGK